MTRIALIAHDDEKPEMLELVNKYRSTLENVELVGTGTTGQRIEEETGLNVEQKLSGKLGGDTQIGAEVAAGEIDAIIFLQDPLSAQPHEPDIMALVRLCDVHDVPLATTRSAGELFLEAFAAEE